MFKKNNLNFVFSEFRNYNSTNLSYNAYNELFIEIKKKIKERATLSISPGKEAVFEQWGVKKTNNSNIIIGNSFQENKIFKFRILNILHRNKIVYIILTVFTDQLIKFPKEKKIKELWGYKMLIKDRTRETHIERISCNELYNAYTIGLNGKKIDPQEEIVYCGHDGKICGWDML
jgi:hypothetical protein